MRKKNYKAPYKSRFEQEFAKARPELGYETTRLEYTTQHTYTPDFSGFTTHYELKGRFRTSAEAAKYIAVMAAHPKLKFRFVFMDADKPMPGARRRKDGTIYTMGEWADRNNFPYEEFSYDK